MGGAISAIFLDRDGVINVNRPDHVKSWAEFQFLSGVFDAMARLAEAGLPVFVVTNQAAINRGLVTRQTVDEINERMSAEIVLHGGRVDDVLYCPHAPEEGCNCRKPRSGLLEAAADKYGLDLTSSYFVGDALSDIQAGQSVGCETIMVLTGRGAEQHQMAVSKGQNGYKVTRDLGEAVTHILHEFAYPVEVDEGRRRHQLEVPHPLPVS